MGWINFAMLGAGLGVGAIGGWLLGRQQSNSRQAGEHTAATTAHFDTSLETSIPPEIHALREQLQLTQLAYQMAKEMEQFKAGFLARTSHELRSPINSVISLHQLILSDLCEDPAEEREFVAQANTSAQKMLSLLDQLIRVAKVTYGTEELRLKPLELDDVLMEVQQFTYLQARNRNLRLNIELPEPGVYVLADPNWLRQVLVSLLDMPISLMEEGSIRLTTHVDHQTNQVHIQIEDERPASFWSEPIDLLERLQTSKPLSSVEEANQMVRSQDFSAPGLMLLIDQMLIEQMNGCLEILATPPMATSSTEEPETSSQVTRIQCSIPLASVAQK